MEATLERLNGERIAVISIQGNMGRGGLTLLCRGKVRQAATLVYVGPRKGPDRDMCHEPPMKYDACRTSQENRMLIGPCARTRDRGESPSLTMGTSTLLIVDEKSRDRFLIVH